MLSNIAQALKPFIFTASILTTKNLLDIYSSGKFDITNKNSYVEMISHINRDVQRKTNGHIVDMIFDSNYIDFTKRVVTSGPNMKHPDEFFGNTFIYSTDTYDRSKYVLYLISMSSIISLATFSVSGIAVLVTTSMFV